MCEEKIVCHMSNYHRSSNCTPLASKYCLQWQTTWHETCPWISAAMAVFNYTPEDNLLLSLSNDTATV
jgi:hypothetical protein